MAAEPDYQTETEEENRRDHKAWINEQAALIEAHPAGLLWTNSMMVMGALSVAGSSSAPRRLGFRR